MIRYAFLTVLPMMAATAACTSVPEDETAPIGVATIISPEGQTIGTARLLAAADTLSLTVQVQGMPQGINGMHLHMTGACDAPDFTSAGGHLNPDDREHGLHNPKGSHLGDLPNLEIGHEGAGSATITLPGTRTELEPILFDSDGTALVIHAEPDDLVTDPTGNSGARIACGVIERV